MQQFEIWLPIKGYEGLYEVSNLGRVKSLNRITNNQYKSYTMPGRILKPGVGKKGYWYVYLTDINSNAKFKQVHQLVGIMFISNPKNKPDVNHIDGIKSHNYVDNLEWNTKSENTQHAYDIGIKVAPRGEDSGTAKLTELAVINIRTDYLSGKRTRELSEMYNVNYTTIDRIIKRKTWDHV